MVVLSLGPAARVPGAALLPRRPRRSYSEAQQVGNTFCNHMFAVTLFTYSEVLSSVGFMSTFAVSYNKNGVAKIVSNDRAAAITIMMTIVMIVILMIFTIIIIIIIVISMTISMTITITITMITFTSTITSTVTMFNIMLIILQSIFEISACFFGLRPWHIEIRHRVKKTSTINLFGFETLKLKIRRLKSWKPTVIIILIMCVTMIPRGRE